MILMFVLLFIVQFHPLKSIIIGHPSFWELEENCSHFESFILLRMWLVSTTEAPLGNLSPRNIKRCLILFMTINTDVRDPCCTTLFEDSSISMLFFVIFVDDTTWYLAFHDERSYKIILYMYIFVLKWKLNSICMFEF